MTDSRRISASALDLPARVATTLAWLVTGATWAGAGIGLAYGRERAGVVMLVGAVVLAAVVVVCRQLQPLGYRFEDDAVVVERRAGDARFAGPVGAIEALADAGSSFRALGTGGIYGHIGHFRLRDGRRVRAHLTNLSRATLVPVAGTPILISSDAIGVRHA